MRSSCHRHQVSPWKNLPAKRLARNHPRKRMNIAKEIKYLPKGVFVRFFAVKNHLADKEPINLHQIELFRQTNNHQPSKSLT